LASSASIQKNIKQTITIVRRPKVPNRIDRSKNATATIAIQAALEMCGSLRITIVRSYIAHTPLVCPEPVEGMGED
jgi:hypothetical protein